MSPDPASQPTTRPAIERMEGVDAGFLYMETPAVHMHTLKIAILEADPHLTYEVFTEGLLARLSKLPPLRRQMVPVPFGLNHPIWITRPTINPSRHIHRHRVPGDGSMRELEVLIGRIASTPLDRRHPLWELHFCEGLADGGVAVVGKMHHALADGGAANALLGNVTDLRSTQLPRAPQVEYATTTRTPNKIKLLRWAWHDAAHQMTQLPALLWRTARGFIASSRYRRRHTSGVPLPVLHAPRTSINGSLTAARTFATASLSLTDFKQLRRDFAAVGVEATINDLVLAVVSGSLRRWMELHDEHPRSSMTAGVPIGIDEADAAPRLGGNLVSNMFTTLASDIDDPVERVRTIARTTGYAKELQTLLGRRTMIDWTQFAPPLPFTGIVRAYSRMRAASWHPSAFTAIVSNVPGPRTPASVGGARLADLFSVGPLADGIGLNVTVWSYVDQMNFSLLACPDLLPDVEVLASYFPAAFDELVEAAAPHPHTSSSEGQATA